MESCDLLSSDKDREYRFVFDTESFGLVQDFSPLYRLLCYGDYDSFWFLRSPEPTESANLAEVATYKITERNERGLAIEYSCGEWKATRAVTHDPELRTRQYKKERFSQPVTETEKEELLSILKALAGNRGEEILFVTEDDRILTNRKSLEDLLTNRNGQPNILSPAEAAEFAGIFMRSQRDYHFYPTEDYEFRLHLTPWYHALERLLLTHKTPDENLSAVLDRFQSLLIAIDQIGEEYFRGVNNDTDIMTRHQFHNAITLLTGVCDTLALYTRDICGTEVSPKHINLKYTKCELLVDLADQHPEAETIIEQNQHLIGLLHVVRNEVVHSSGVISRGPGTFVVGGNEQITWSSHVLSINNLMDGDQEKFAQHYYQLDDQPKDHDPITEWGVIIGEGTDEPRLDRESWIEPYQFVKKAVSELCLFTNEYLDMLEVPNRGNADGSAGMLDPTTVRIIDEHGLFPLLFERSQLEERP